MRRIVRIALVACLAAPSVRAEGAAATGELSDFAPSHALRRRMARYGFRAVRYREGTNGVSALLLTPRSRAGRPEPLLVYIPGSGERGDTPARLFRQRALFDRVASADFQARRPCHLLAIAPPPSATTLLGGLPGSPSSRQRLLYGLVRAVAARRVRPPVDTNRIYATGFSYGGNGVYALALHYPGTFAAVLPIAALPPGFEYFDGRSPGNWWHFHNEGDYRAHGIDLAGLMRFGAAVNGAGGDFRVGSYPAEGHDAWTAAWREEEVWTWMFSKSLADAASGSPRAASGAGHAPLPLADARCTANVPGTDGGCGPGRVVDGLATTGYVAARPAARGDWWQAAFARPVGGGFCLVAGRAEGVSTFGAVVEVSGDGRTWRRAGRLTAKSPVCRFSQGVPVRFLRVRVIEPGTGPLALRQLTVLPER